MRRVLFSLSALGALAAAVPAQAGRGETTLRARMAAAQSGAAETSLAALTTRRPADQQARYALGVAQLTNAIETLGQGLYRLGYTGVNIGRAGSVLLSMPVPANPNPAIADYAAVRALLSQLVADLDEARETLAGVDDPRVKLTLDLDRMRLDFNGDGRGDAALGDILGRPDPDAGAAASRVFGFDRADAIWLQGYAQLLAAPADFILAHDFATMTDATFQRLFTRAGMALRNAPERSNENGGFVGSDFADAIAAVHFMRWPVVEPERRARVRERLLAVSALSRANWAAIRAETDNDHEWLPNPRQTSAFPGLEITDARIDAWLGFLDTWDAVLNGEKLLPHWRFTQGMDMRAFFEDRAEFDLVSLLTGYGALPYLKDGPIVSGEELRELQQQMGPQALLFAAWFN